MSYDFTLPPPEVNHTSNINILFSSPDRSRYNLNRFRTVQDSGNCFIHHQPLNRLPKRQARKTNQQYIDRMGSKLLRLQRVMNCGYRFHRLEFLFHSVHDMITTVVSLDSTVALSNEEWSKEFAGTFLGYRLPALNHLFSDFNESHRQDDQPKFPKDQRRLEETAPRDQRGIVGSYRQFSNYSHRMSICTAPGCQWSR